MMKVLMEWPHISCTEYPMQLTMPLSTLRMVPSVRAQALAMSSEGSACANARGVRDEGGR